MTRGTPPFSETSIWLLKSWSRWSDGFEMRWTMQLVIWDHHPLNVVWNHNKRWQHQAVDANYVEVSSSLWDVMGVSPKAGWFICGKIIIRKWMMTRGTPILGNPHVNYVGNGGCWDYNSWLWVIPSFPIWSTSKYVDLRRYLYLCLSLSPFPSPSFHVIDRHGISICPARCHAAMPWARWWQGNHHGWYWEKNGAHRLLNNHFHRQNDDDLKDGH